MKIYFWFGVGIGIEQIKRKNDSKEIYLILPFVRIRIIYYHNDYIL
ncbi:MAG: hypothetical protein GQ564_10460 [Bacteroidales bacterium]|nr:hypothetical protein [Bacteroidales bacterium]